MIEISCLQFGKPSGCSHTHVVLPLLREAFVTPGWVSDDAFLAGYGAAQAVPGPLFTFAAYLGAVVRQSPHGLAGAALGLIAIFLPGVLILTGTLPFWETFRKRADAQAMMARRQRRSGRPARRGALQSGLDEFGQNAGRLRNRTRWFCTPHRLAYPATGHRHHQRARRYRPGTCHGVTGGMGSPALHVRPEADPRARRR